MPTKTYYEPHPSLLSWPLSTLFLLWVIPLLIFFVFWTWYKYELDEYTKFNNLFEKRISEIITLKLTGAAPYLWKPLLSCQGLQEDILKKEDCLILTMEFWEKKNPPPENSKLESTQAPCLICHKEKKQVLFVARTKFPSKPNLKFYGQLYGLFLGGFTIFFGFLFWKRKNLLKKKWYLVGINFFSVDLTTLSLDFLNFLRKQKPRFFYGEEDGSTIFLVIPPGNIKAWMKKVLGYFAEKRDGFFPAFVFEEIAVSYNLVIPYQEMRKIRYITEKLPPASMALPEELFLKFKEFSKNPEKIRKGIYKTKDGQNKQFYLITL